MMTLVKKSKWKRKKSTLSNSIAIATMAETSDLKELLLLELECPVCTSAMIGSRHPQVIVIARKSSSVTWNSNFVQKICLNGHACCSYCCPRLPFCPTCRNPSGWARSSWGISRWRCWCCGWWCWGQCWEHCFPKVSSPGTPWHCLTSTRPGPSSTIIPFLPLFSSITYLPTMPNYISDGQAVESPPPSPPTQNANDNYFPSPALAW